MLLLMAIAVMTGVLPGALSGVPLALPAWMAVPGTWLVGGAALAVLCLVPVLANARVRRRMTEAAGRARRGLAVFTQVGTLRPALLGQFAAWLLRLGSIACFLAAFGITPTPTLIVLVVIAQILASLVPIAPSGVGAQQGLIVLVLGGVASTQTALAFGVGMQAAVLTADVLAGLVALGLCGGWLSRPRAPAIVEPAAG